MCPFLGDPQNRWCSFGEIFGALRPKGEGFQPRQVHDVDFSYTGHGPLSSSGLCFQTLHVREQWLLSGLKHSFSKFSVTGRCIDKAKNRSASEADFCSAGGFELSEASNSRSAPFLFFSGVVLVGVAFSTWFETKPLEHPPIFSLRHTQLRHSLRHTQSRHNQNPRKLVSEG